MSLADIGGATLTGGSAFSSTPAPAGISAAAVTQNLSAFQRDPLGIARQVGLNLPSNLSADPRGMVNYLQQTGQINAAELNQVLTMARSLGFRV